MASRAKVHALLVEWQQLGLGIVCVQETWARTQHAATLWERTIEGWLAAAGAAPPAGGRPLPTFTPFWASNSSEAHHRGGTAVLIRSDLLAGDRAALRVLGKPARATDGRSMSLRLEWCGHRFLLANAYLPSGEAARQADFASSRLPPLGAGNLPVVLAGDFNFTPDHRQDRAGWQLPGAPPPAAPAGQADPAVALPGPPPAPPPPPPPGRPRRRRRLQAPQPRPQQPPLAWGRRRDPGASHRDTPPAAAMAATCAAAGWVDVWRWRHPSRRCYTHFHHHATGCSAARLDRIYADRALLPYVERCAIGGATGSDHRAVVLHLRPLLPTAIGPGTPRMRMHFWAHQQLREELLAWLEAAVADLPAGDGDLLAAWPWFKRALSRRVAELNRQARAATQGASAALDAARTAHTAALGALDAAGTQAALAAALTARERFVAAATGAAAASAQRARVSWLHSGERPCPLLTKLTRPPAAARYVAALRTRGGGLITAPQPLTQLMADYFAGVSAAPPRDASAEARVLTAVSAAGRRLDAADAAAAGEAEVSEAEVVSACQRSAPGKAPGPDGIPPELWRHCSAVLAPTLARLFSAAGRLHRLPDFFLDGVLATLYKKGDAADPANYRPITLLNTDYRMLAKVLAMRLAPGMGRALGPEQAAFLPGRLIGDNITLLQLLPTALQSNAEQPRAPAQGAALPGGPGLPGGGAGAQGAAPQPGPAGPTTAAVAFLDFAKAFDTVSRPFLFAVMERMGAGRPGEGLVGWAELLLGETRAAAATNGFVSRPAATRAGVRQGCPISPLLYLFVAHALWAWLQAPEWADAIGIEVAGQRLTSTHFADDGQVVLRDLAPATVQRFLGAMAIFAAASGQRLNVAKTQLLALGALPPGGSPQQVGGLAVVAEAEALGMRFSNSPGDAAAGVDWEARLEGVEACYSRVARLPLSAFGRAFAASGYGISKLLYHAEFAGLPAGVAARLAKLSTKLVDRGQAPRDTKRRLPGVESAVLPGRPADGGFGLLPWPQHVMGRHAAWAVRLLRHLAPGLPGPPGPGPPALDAAPPWAPLARMLLQRLCPAAPPALSLLSCAWGVGGGRVAEHLGQDHRGVQLPPGPLRRMGEALHALGPPAHVGPGSLQLGPWCAACPLWANPLLRLELPLARRPVLEPPPAAPAPPAGHSARLDFEAEQRHMAVWAESGFGSLLAMPGLRTLGDLMALIRRLSAWEAPHAAAARLAARLHLPIGLDRRLAFRAQVWQATALPATLNYLADPDNGGPAIKALWRAIPGSWRRAAAPLPGGAAAGAVPAVPGEAPRVLLERMGWRLPGGGHTVPLVGPPFTVRTATRLQLEGVWARRAQLHELCARTALAAAGGDAATVSPALAQQGVRALRAALKAAWACRWENEQKEVLWRLSVGGVCGAGGHGICTAARPCACGWHPPAGVAEATRAWHLQRHVFWGCPAAGGVVAELQRCLPPAAEPLEARHVWLLSPPARAGVGADEWIVVCMAALSAMEKAHRCAWRYSLEAAEQRAAGGRQATIDELWGVELRRQAAEAAGALPADGGDGAGGPGPAAAPPIGEGEGGEEDGEMGQGAGGAGAGVGDGPIAAGHAGVAAAAGLWVGLGLHRPPLPRAARRAVEDFWGRLQEFAGLGMPGGWAPSQGAPFLAGDGAGRLVPNRPPLVHPLGV